MRVSLSLNLLSRLRANHLVFLRENAHEGFLPFEGFRNFELTDLLVVDQTVPEVEALLEGIILDSE